MPNKKNKPPVKFTQYLNNADILMEMENTIDKLREKETAFNEIADEYSKKKFNIMFIEDINFKEIYGKANDDVRKHHAKVTLQDLRAKKNDLKIEIDYLKRRLKLLKSIMDLRTQWRF